MAEPLALKYRAFISYSHADTSWAKWLHRGLEGFRIDKDLVGHETSTGTIPKTLRPIFRDRDDFTAGHTLTEQTLAALDASHALIVICSPASAKSHYVNEEIRRFKSRHSDRPVIPVIVGGTPNDAKDECFSPALKFKVTPGGKVTHSADEPLAADVREEGDGKHLAFAKVVAGLLGVSSDDIFRRAERERHRQGRIRSTIGLVIAGLIALGGFLAWQSHQQQQTIAEVEALVAKYSVASQTDAGAPRSKEGLTQAITAIAEGAAGDARYAQALELLKAGKPAEAEPLLKAIAKEKETRIAHDSKQAAAAYENLGAITRLSNPKRAREAYAKAAVLDPDNAEALYWNGRLQFEARNLDASEQAYKRLLTVKENKGAACEHCWALYGLGDVAEKRGQSKQALKYYRDGLVKAGDFANANRDNVESQLVLGAAYDRIGGVLQTQGKLNEALQFYRDNLANSDRLAKIEPNTPRVQRNLWVSYAKLGNLLALQGNFDQALKALQDGLAIVDRLTKTEPENEEWQRELGVSYELIGKLFAGQGNLDKALQYIQGSLPIKERLVRGDPDNAEHHTSLLDSNIALGDVLLARANLAEAMKRYRACLAIADHLARSNPENPIWQRHLSTSLTKIGDVLVAQDSLSEAMVNYQIALDVLENLAQNEPGSADRQRDVADAYIKLGDAQLKDDKREEALTSYQRSLTIRRRLGETDKDNGRWQADVAASLSNIGQVKLGSGDSAGALTAYEEMVSITRHLVDTDKNNIEWQQSMAVSLDGIGSVKISSGDIAGALAAYEGSLAIRRQLAETNKDNTQLQQDLLRSLKRLADAKLSSGDSAEAVIDYKRIDLKPGDPNLHNDPSYLHDRDERVQ